jgi:nitrite reductase/ring-hydroxylating ferredoxin subunit/uncharacterized membrane protein
MPVGAKLRSAVDGGLGAMRPAGAEPFTERIERLKSLDPTADLLQRGVRAVVPPDTVIKDLLSGTWLGHPLHPPLTDVVVGAWTSSWLLDATARRARAASQLLIGAGILAALPTAAAGASDWADLRGGSRRVGLVHAIANTTALTLQILSLRARRRGDHGSGVGLSTLAMATVSVSAWLGGHLSFGRGVGVNQTAFEDFPSAWTALAKDDELQAGHPLRREADGVGVLLVRHHGEIYAIADRCSHRGCSLADGTLRDGTITCRCHGSTFTLDGRIVTGPATAPQPALETRVHEGTIEVRRRRSESD